MLLSRYFHQGRNAEYGGKGTHPGNVVIGAHDLGLSCLPYDFSGLLTSWEWYLFNGSQWAAGDFGTPTAENSGTNAMSADGLLLTTGAADGNGNWFQLTRSKIATANKLMVAYARLSLGDVTNTGMVFGLAETVTDWFSAESASSAAFLKAKGAATMVGRSKDGTNGSSTGTLATLVNDTLVDLSVIHDYMGSAPVVRFGVKLASAQWQSSDFTVKTTNMPDDKQRLTVVLENNEGSANTMLIKKMFWGAMI
jgi:hypothetical protein